jgi:tetratricopeptide (TPR) repeat protein
MYLANMDVHMQKNKIINRSIFISIVHSLLLIFFISASIAQIDNKEFDRKLFQVLEKEYSAASRVFKQKRNASNAFRLFSIQMELLKLVKSKHVELSLKSSNPASYMNNQKSRGELYKSYKSTIGLAKYIENNYKSFPDIGKFYFLYGLSIYEFDEKSSEVGRTLEKSIKLMRDNELLHLARGRLGDYYFNVGNFRAAATNYFEALRLDNNSEWKYRYHHNLAWSYFKSQELGRAIDTLKLLIKKASAAKDTTDYFYSQAVKKLPFFYVYANKPDEGYQFVKDYSGVEGRELFEFLQITYEKGFFDRLDFYIVDVEKILTSMKKEQALLEFRIAIHNYIAELDYKKNNELMARLRSGIVEAHRKNPMPEESKKSFVNNIKRMVNENISVVNRPAFDYKNKLDKEILDDTVEMLKIVMDIDNKDAAGNRLKLAQLYRKGNRAEEALQLLLTDYQKMSQDNSPASIKILEEMLVISEQIKPENSKINIEQIYQDYLKKGDDPKIRSSVFLKMFDIKFAKKDLITSFELTKKFGKEFPNQTEPLKKMISKILAQSFATNETKMTNQVRSYALTIPAIKNDAKFMKDLRTSQQSVDFNEINAGLGGKQNSSISEKNKSAETLREIYQDGLIDRSNRLVAGFNAAIMFVDLGRVSDANVIFGSLLSEYDQKEFSDYQERIVTVAETQVVLGQESFSTPILESIYAKNCKFNLKQKSDFYIKLAEIYTLRSDYDKLINHVAQGDKCQVSSESKSSVYRLVNEYVDFNKKDEVVSFFALLNKKIINSQTEIDRAVENWIILKINEVAVINQSTLKKIYDELYKMMSGKTSSRVLQEYTEVVGTYGAQVPYEKMPLTVEKFQVFVEKNVNNFNRNISVYANRKYTYSVTKYLNALLEVNTIERFLSFWKVVPSLVVKKEETQEYVKQINEFLLPYQDKYKQLSKGLDIALDQGALLIRHRKLEDATNLKFRPKRPLLRNVGDL